MSKSRQVRATAVAVVLVSALAGCAVYRKCGLDGCAGDAQVTAQVQALLELHPALLAQDSIHVHTWDRVVYLYGLVNTEMERGLAESVALEAPGAQRVVNLIGVNNGSR